MWTKAWPSLEITNLGRSVQEVRRLVREPDPDQTDDVSRALARFLVVRASGYLEQVIRESCLAYITSKSDLRVREHAKRALRPYLNPKPGRLVELVGGFDPTWAEELEALLDDDDQFLRREISLLVDRRNKISHGLSEGVTSTKALDLLEAAEQVAAWFVSRFDPR